MSTQIFNNRPVFEPGAYSRIQNSGPNPSNGIVDGLLIIDYDENTSYGGAGINGELRNGKRAVFEFNRAEDFRNHIHGGPWYEMANLIFSPAGLGESGAQRVLYVNAATTTAAAASMTLNNGANGGTIALKAYYEGTDGNGVEVSSTLTRGFAWTIQAGVRDAAKYLCKFWRGSFRGLSGTEPIGGTAEADTKPILLAQSPEFTNIAELEAWMKSDPTFLAQFEVGAVVVTGTGELDPTDISGNAGNNLFAGATNSNATTDYEAVLDVINDFNFGIIVTDRYGSEVSGTEANLIFTWLQDVSEYKRVLILGGSSDAANFETQSITAAQTYNSDLVAIVTGGITYVDPETGVLRQDMSSWYAAAMVAGRISGLPAQVPGTFKTMNLVGVTHELSPEERKYALENGVIHMREVDGFWVINQSISTLQDNTYPLDGSGRASEISITRIGSIIQQELVTRFRHPETGFVGRNEFTATAEDVKMLVEGYLNSIVASPTVDGLISSFKNISVSRETFDTWHVTFIYSPNLPINKIYITATVSL